MKALMGKLASHIRQDTKGREELRKVITSRADTNEIKLSDGTVYEVSSIKRKPRLKCVGRLRHEKFIHKGKIVHTVSFTLLKRKSNLLLNDMICDVEIDIDCLQLHKYKEGLYEIIICNESRDYETGIVDDWELKLIPYKEDKVENGLG